jgi:ADP-ribose pyrophosphatase YjhB (NUDIX family)
MTNVERENIKNSSFDELWKNLWCKEDDNADCRNFNREYQDSKCKFNRLLQGYVLKDSLEKINIFSCLSDTVSGRDEAEWGFPKGRRNVNESDLCCALREFEEETGYDPNKYIDILTNVAPICEEFIGTNSKKYKHVYYIALWRNNCFPLQMTNSYCHEIRCVKWFDYENAQIRISDENPTRKKILSTVNDMMKQY